MESHSSAEARIRLLWTIRETSACLNVGRSTVYELIRAKELEIVKIGRCTRVLSDSVEAFLQRIRRRPNRSLDLDGWTPARMPRSTSDVGAP
jgi:excisionase family DNA binding protein